MSYATKEQQAEYARGHYARNIEAYKDRRTERRLRIRTFVQDLKSVPCVDCGQGFHFSAMDFDHISGEKVIWISRAVGQCWSEEKILAEVAKCDIVCSNCHRIRTFNRIMAT